MLFGAPPTDLSQLPALDEQIRSKQPAVRTILWDYQSAYYSWGIFASAGAYIFRKKGTNYDLANVGLATPGAVQALSQIISLVKENILPPSVSYSQTEELMGQGKLAMTISGPWAWSNLIRSGISFGVAPMRDLNRCVMDGEVMPNIPEMGRFFSALGGAIQVAAQNRLSPQIALEDAATQLRQERHR